MLLLMRRPGESIRIKDDIIITIKHINENHVTFIIEGLDNTLENEIMHPAKK